MALLNQLVDGSLSPLWGFDLERLGVAIHLSRRWRSPRLVRHAHPTRDGRHENSIACAIKIATGRSLLQSDKQIHNTGSRFGEEFYRTRYSLA